MLNSTFSAKPLSTRCIHKSHTFKMERGTIITSNHITRLWTTTKTPELIPISGYLITGLRSGWLLFPCSSSFMSTSLSSLLYRIKMCYPHFNVFGIQKGLLCKFFHIFWVQVLALLLSFLKAFLDNCTRREVWAAGKSLLSVAKTFSKHIKCPVHFGTSFVTSLFQPQSNLPDSPRWGQMKRQNTTPGGQISDQKSLYAPIIPLYVPGPGGWGFQLVH